MLSHQSGCPADWLLTVLCILTALVALMLGVLIGALLASAIADSLSVLVGLAAVCLALLGFSAYLRSRRGRS